MKKILFIVIVNLVAVTCFAAELNVAGTKTLPSTTTSPFATYATGEIVSSGHESYTIMPGVFAAVETQSNNTPSLQTAASNTTHTLTTKGNFTVFTKATTALQVQNTAGATNQPTQAPTGNDKLVVYNNRTKNVGVVTGSILVRYQQGVDIASALSNLPVSVVLNSDKLRFAFVKPNSTVDIFAVASSIEQVSGVISANVEVLENIKTPQ